MPIKIPETMDDCLYFTNRSIGAGSVIAWVYRKLCPKCKKVKMGKPNKDGKVKARAQIYVCPGCGYTEEKIEHEESLNLEAVYTCPECGKGGESTGIYQRKKFKGVLSYLVECAYCQAKIPLTKKLKGVKLT